MGTTDRPTYWISDRPEAYELWGEITPHDAARVARLIVDKAGAAFPDIVFRIDSEWHVHQQGMDRVSAFIDDHLEDWVFGGDNPRPLAGEGARQRG